MNNPNMTSPNKQNSKINLQLYDKNNQETDYFIKGQKKRMT